MSLSKITTTVGLNSKRAPEGCGLGADPRGCRDAHRPAGDSSPGCSLCSRWPVVKRHPGELGHSLTPVPLSPVGTVDVGKARLMFWDLGGQEELQSLWDKVRHMPHGTCPRAVSLQTAPVVSFCLF